MVYDIWCMLYGGYCMIHNALRVTYYVCYMMYDVWCVAYDV